MVSQLDSLLAFVIVLQIGILLTLKVLKELVMQVLLFNLIFLMELGHLRSLSSFLVHVLFDGVQVHVSRSLDIQYFLLFTLVLQLWPLFVLSRLLVVAKVLLIIVDHLLPSFDNLVA